jgi:hypothetical protein
MQVATRDRDGDVVGAFNKTMDVVSKNMTATDGRSNDRHSLGFAYSANCSEKSSPT